MTEVASPRHEFVSFLSDYGRADEFVGVCTSVMLAIAPHLRVIDVTHDVPPHDVRAGALTLVRAAQYLPVGIILAVVERIEQPEHVAVIVAEQFAEFIGQ